MSKLWNPPFAHKGKNPKKSKTLKEISKTINPKMTLYKKDIEENMVEPVSVAELES